MLYLSHNVAIGAEELEFCAIRAQGAGGQNVNKVSSAIHLRFDFERSTLPEHYKSALRELRDQRITNAGVIVIKAQQFRTQEKNRLAALDRLRDLILTAVVKPPKRIPTKPSKAAKARRIDAKTARSKIKLHRKKIDV